MKQIQSIIPAATQGHWVGDGFPVRSIFGKLNFSADISPFLMFDYGGPLAFSPTTDKRGVGPHPHRGFETVTLAFQGEVEHGDSVGNRGVIRPGDVQWMSAAAGIVHEEFHSRAFAQQGGVLEMVQLWVNLPAQFKMSAPRYQAIVSDAIPVVALPDAAGSVRVVAGDFDGVKGAAQTYSPIDMWDITLDAGKSATLTVPDGHTAMLFVRSGKLTCNGQLAGSTDLVHFSREGSSIVLDAQETSQLLLLGGAPIDEPIVAQGPFVMNSAIEIQQAMDDYRNGRMGQLDA